MNNMNLKLLLMMNLMKIMTNWSNILLTSYSSAWRVSTVI